MIRPKFIAGACAIVISSLQLTLAQESLSFRLCDNKDGKLDAPPHKVVLLSEDSWIALLYKTSVQASIGKVNLSYEYYLATIDPATLLPKLSKKWEFKAPWGKAALEDVFVNKGHAYALITLQDKSGNHLSVNVSPVDPATLERGTLVEIFNDPNATDLPGGSDREAQPLGLKASLDADGKGWSIVDDPVGRTAGSAGAAQATYKAVYYYAFHLDTDLHFKWGGSAKDIKGLSSFIMAMVPDGKGSVFILGGFGKKSDELDPAEVHMYKFDGVNTKALPSKNVGPENTPLDLKAVIRPDGKLLCAGIYGRVKAGLSLGGTDTRGAFVGLFDMAKGDWDSFELVPILNEKGKEVEDLSFSALEAAPDNSAQGFVQLIKQGSYGPEASDIWPVSIDISGKPTVGTIFSFTGSGNAPSIPNAVVWDGKVRLLLQDMPDNAVRRTEGKSAKGGMKPQPSVAVFDATGHASQVFPTTNIEPGRSIAVSGIWPIGKGVWATWGSVGTKTVMGAIEAK